MHTPDGKKLGLCDRHVVPLTSDVAPWTSSSELEPWTWKEGDREIITNRKKNPQFYIIPILTYGRECWKITTSLERKLEATKTWFHRSMVGIHLSWTGQIQKEGVPRSAEMRGSRSKESQSGNWVYHQKAGSWERSGYRKKNKRISAGMTSECFAFVQVHYHVNQIVNY